MAPYTLESGWYIIYGNFHIDQENVYIHKFDGGIEVKNVYLQWKSIVSYGPISQKK